MQERSACKFQKSLHFEEGGEVFSVEITLENVSASIKTDSITPYLEVLFSKALADLERGRVK